MSNANNDTMADAPLKSQDPHDYSQLLQTDHSDAFAFSEQEQVVLALYDQLQELELECSLLEAQENAREPDVSPVADHVLQKQLVAAESALIEVQAEYELRNRITQKVLIMDPVLKAVHGGEHTDYAEKRILPLITENDIVSMVHSSLASRLSASRQALSAAEEQNIAANDKNKDLARTLLTLAEDFRSQSTKDIEDPQLRVKVEKEEKGLKASRRRMMTLKGLISGLIVGSGIDWAADSLLRELVMDDEEDG
ncbi:centromere protein H (CENP-H)-domain-containing protein [Clohesyomyces aquaticus]|uniref:Centromere protein H (CENP-H)-domain-containing protein n=1 Tax=Clohesyomyces aquaticus TaxID=1231657 RepID=A0A1Y1ZW48_9PLEO|nr:centromere protein H (CENP-H)-domain-containing protein [Clohesyomyces aquaticus]